MLATISPANVHLDETLATLRYACQARSIVNRVYKNEDANERMIRYGIYFKLYLFKSWLFSFATLFMVQQFITIQFYIILKWLQ